MSELPLPLGRIANALERIAEALESGPALEVTPNVTNIYLDGEQISRSVTKHVIRRADRGPSPLVGGSLLSPSTALTVNCSTCKLTFSGDDPRICGRRGVLAGKWDDCCLWVS